MIRAVVALGAALTALSLAKSGSCADWYPASPLQPAGRGQGSAPAPAATPSLIPLAAPATASPQSAIPAAAPLGATDRVKTLSCEDVCAQASLKIVFAYEGGRIGTQSRVELDAGEPFEMRAFAETCPHFEGKESSTSAETLPDGCVFLFVIPAARATQSGARPKRDLRCSGGKVGMFHCNESNSPSSSFTSDALSRD